MRPFRTPLPSRHPTHAGRALVLAAALLAPLAARAAPQERPLLFPSRDVTVTYQVQSPDAPVKEATAAVAAGGSHVRIESPGMAGAMLLDRARGSMTMVLNGMHMYSVVPGRGRMVDEFLLDPRLHFARAGTATVDGLSCTRWDVSSDKGSGTGCVTADGVLLRFQGHDTRGREASLLATSVHYGPIPAASFQPPAGFQEMDIPGFGK